MNLPKAGLQEIFSSIQGEGPYVGKRQIFVRFNACHLACAYCDTPQRPAARQCEVELVSGSGNRVMFENPMSVETVRDVIQRLHGAARHHSISFTGGEPLLYTDFLEALLPTVSEWLPVYLETSGTQPDKLEAILPWVQIIAMDIKLPSATGEPMQMENHRRFYQLARSREIVVKLVFCEQTTVEELACVADIVTDRAMPVILQPMTDLATGNMAVSPAKIFALTEALEARFEDVRVIPQTHKMLAVL